MRCYYPAWAFEAAIFDMESGEGGEVKIVCLSDLWLPFPGGAERYIANISQALIDRGHEVHVLTSYAPAKPVHCTRGKTD